jgi:uncharacterized protein
MSRIVVSVVQLPQNLLIWLVKCYRLLLSPWLGNACRFEPTCSVYAMGALEQHGAISGSCYTLYRLARCQPWCQGGHDPVPQQSLFTRLVTPVSKQHLSAEKKSS